MALSEQERKEALLEEAYIHVMSTPMGRKVIDDILKISGMSENSARKGGFRTNETFYNNGCRAVGITLDNKVSGIAPASYLLMIKECKNG